MKRESKKRESRVCKNRLWKRVTALCLTLIVVLWTADTIVTGNLLYGKYEVATGKALNSPILNNTFAKEDWNKWEMVCWGVFLSNFCEPGVDTYESAFTTKADFGSKGNGYKALVFGTGSDATNNETIEKLTNFAIDTRKSSGGLPIYIGQDKDGNKGKLDADGKPMPVVMSSYDSTLTYKKATINDLFISNGKRKLKYYLGTYSRDILTESTLNSFYIQNGSSFYEVWNNLNSWDIQVLGSTFGKISTSAYYNEADKNIQWAFDNKAELVWDCFGNICFKNEDGELIVLVQAANNQHLTKDNAINIVTSLVMNSSTNSSVAYTKQNLLDYAGQGEVTNSGWKAAFFESGNNLFDENNSEGGVNAVGADINSSLNGKCVMYYDTDTIQFNSADGTNYGDILATVFALDMNKETGNAFVLKMSPMGGDKLIDEMPEKNKTKNAMAYLAATYNNASTIADQCNTSKNVKTMTSYKNLNSQKIALIGEPVYIPVQTMAAYTEDREPTYTYIARRYIDYLGNRYNGIGGSSTASSQELKDIQKLVKQEYNGSASGMSLDTSRELFSETLVDKLDGAKLTVSPIYMDFIRANATNLYDIKGKNDLINQVFSGKAGTFSLTGGDASLLGMMATHEITGTEGTKITVKKSLEPAKMPAALSKLTYPGRVIKAYAQSSEMIGMSNALNVTNGTDFSVYCSMIYLTYLDWYGLKQDTEPTGDKTFTSDFKEPLFDWCKGVLPENIEKIADTMSDTDLEKQIIKYSFLSLNPNSEEAREYREQMQMQGIQDLVYNQYSKICYGGSNSNGVSSKSNAGFLKIHTYDENMFTGFFIRGYSDIAIWLIGFLALSIVIMGIIKNKKLSWFLLTLAVSINALLVVPSYGEITPYVANKAVQGIFKGKMTFWSLSEQIADMERQSQFNADNAYLSTLSDVEKNTILSTVDSLDGIQLDRALMFKQDISSKIVYSNGDAFNKVQQYKSARWLLPMIMQQYRDDTADNRFVYKSIGDKLESAANCYWYFNPIAANSVDTLSAKSDFNQSKYTDGTGNVNVGLMGKHNGHSTVDTNKDTTYRGIAYTRPNATTSMSDKYNTFFYIADGDYRINNYSPKYNGFQTDEDLLQYFKDNDIGANKDGFKSLALQMQVEATKNIASDRTTYNSTLPYLQATETPLEYFYMAVSNSFSEDASYAYVVSQLQGDFDTIAVVEENEDGKNVAVEKEIRTGMCYEKGTGYVVDVLDLEHMFKDMLPYMYGMQIMAGGVDGKSGYLGELKLDDYEVYKETSQAWLFQSNWVTKIIDNPEYCGNTTIGIGDGEFVEIKNQALPQEYEAAGREMVFSEAQQKSMKLHNEDLSLLELKLVKINKDVADKWTLLLNYVGTDGINKEILIRQMAIEGMTEFNRTITSTSVFNSNYEMFPSSVDLRSISFDSVMKMLVLNVTKDTSYIYGDTMKILIQETDIGTAALLLICSYLCCYIVPLARDIMLAILLYGSIMSIVYNIFGGNNQKMRVTLGSLISAIVVTVGTIAYYGLFSLMLKMTSSDEVLSVSSVSIEAGNPLWLFLAIIMLSLTYIVGIGFMSVWCLKNFRDAGKTVYSEMQRSATESFTNGMGKLRNRMGDVGDRVSGLGSTMGDLWENGYSTEMSEKAVKRSKKVGLIGDIDDEDLSTVGSYDDQFKRKDSIDEKVEASIEKVEQEIKSIDKEIEKGLEKKQNTES